MICLWRQGPTKQRQESVALGFLPVVPLDLVEETRREVVEFLEKVGAGWEMAATSLRCNVLLDPEECYDGEDCCADAYDDTLVGSYEGF